MKKIYWAVFIVVAVGVTAVILYKIEKPEPSSDPIYNYASMLARPPVKSAYLPTALKASSWQTYSNNQYGFDFQYPTTLQIITDYGQQGLYKGFDFGSSTKISAGELCLQSNNPNNPLSFEELPCTLDISATSTNLSLENFIKKYSEGEFLNPVTIKQVSLGVNTWTLVSDDGPGIGNWFMFTTQGKVAVIASVTNLMDYNSLTLTPLANQILSTLNFVSK